MVSRRSWTRERRRGARGAAVALVGISFIACQAGCEEVLGLGRHPGLACEAGDQTCVRDVDKVCTEDREAACAAGQQICSEGACQDVLALAAGGSTTCARLSGGGVFCWGLNAQGQCGQAPDPDEPADARPVPVRVELPGHEQAVDIAVGGEDGESGHACALTAAGEVWCWGDDRFSQAGRPPEGWLPALWQKDLWQRADGWTLPHPVGMPPEVRRIDQVRAGPGRTCAIGLLSEDEDPEGRIWLWCWGRNTEQQMIPGMPSRLEYPRMVPSLTGVTDVAFGLEHMCALAEGRVICWGSAAAAPGGTFEDGPAGMTEIALGGHAVRSIAAGDHHTCAATEAGVYCWGSNSCGQVAGDAPCAEPCGGAPACPVPPTLVEPFPQEHRQGGEHAYLIAAAARRTCVQWPSGDVKCWGRDTGTQFEDAPANEATKWLPDLGAAELDLGNRHTCARLAGGEVQCWGRNDHGQLGVGDAGDHEETGPVKWYDPMDQIIPPPPP